MINIKFALALAIALLTCTGVHAQSFDTYFTDLTLRADYLFSGSAKQQHISLHKLSKTPGWAGRRSHLDELPLKGDGQITMRDAESGSVIYRTSFSSLFQEWLDTDEAQQLEKSFENPFLLPFPIKPAEVEVTICNKQQQITASMKHMVDPNDILIQHRGFNSTSAHRYIVQNGPAEKCIDVAILAEGYTADEMETFYADAVRAVESLQTYEPFKSLASSFNFVAVGTPSADSGVSIPKNGDWKNTAFGSHFSTFYSTRYLTTTRMEAIYDALAGIPFEHIVVLANTDEYGGGGIYNSLMLTAAHHSTFTPVMAHEFGHSFAGLADEYFYENDVMTDTYVIGVEPWEQNVTTLVNFDSKWKDMLPKDLQIPSTDQERGKIGVYEGGAYSSKGIYRPSFNCRMRTNSYPEFCAVCQRAIKRVIEFYTQQ